MAARKPTTKATQEEAVLKAYTVKALRKCYYGGNIRKPGDVFVFEFQENKIPDFLEIIAEVDSGYSQNNEASQLQNTSTL